MQCVCKYTSIFFCNNTNKRSLLRVKFDICNGKESLNVWNKFACLKVACSPYGIQSTTLKIWRRIHLTLDKLYWGVFSLIWIEAERTLAIRGLFIFQWFFLGFNYSVHDLKENCLSLLSFEDCIYIHETITPIRTEEGSGSSFSMKRSQ